MDSMIRYVFPVAVLLATSSAAQQGVPNTGAALPTLAEVFEIPWELPFTLPKGTVLPDSVHLSPWFPPAGDQFAQASCSGWALGYGLASYHWNSVREQHADTVFLRDPTNVFSPAFVYTLVAAAEGFTDCTTGVSLPDAISVLCNTGAATWQQFPVDTATYSCLHPVPDSVLAAAALHSMANPVAIGNRDHTQWRYHLSLGEPIIFLVSIGPFFKKGFLTGGSKPFVWNEPFPTDWNDRTGHIMVCTGYNADSTFMVLNSWGQEWGERGYVRIPDSTLFWACSEAYVLRPGTVPASPLLPATVKERNLRADGSTRGSLGRKEQHATDSLLIRTAGTTAKGAQQLVEIRDPDGRERLHTLAVRRHQATTFHHAGALYTFTYTGRGVLSRQLRYTLVKNDPKQRRNLQERLDTYDLHGDGVLDGKW